MTAYMTAAQELLECYRAALEDPAFPATPAQICLRHGDEVAPLLGTQTDECCDGLAWVRIVRTESLRGDEAFNTCVTSERRVTLEMGGVHCLPWGTVEAPATCDQWTSVALLADAYHDAMEQALCCLRASLTRDQADVIRPGDYEPRRNDANCAGGTMQVVIETSCGCSAGG